MSGVLKHRQRSRRGPVLQTKDPCPFLCKLWETWCCCHRLPQPLPTASATATSPCMSALWDSVFVNSCDKWDKMTVKLV